jgi:hypothetical protein
VIWARLSYMTWQYPVGELRALCRAHETLQHGRWYLRLEHAFKDTSQWTGLRVAENLPSFLEYYCSATPDSGNLKEASEVLSAPHTIVVTSSGMRAANLTRFVEFFYEWLGLFYWKIIKGLYEYSRPRMQLWPNCLQNILNSRKL